MKTVFILIAFVALGVVAVPSVLAEIGASRLDGAWQPDHYGTRVEIAGDTIVVLWRNAPVLETKFTVSRDGGRQVLHLEKTGLRYADAQQDFATVTGCWVEDGKMHLCQRYDIVGDDEEILEPTTESRYGDVTIVTEKLLPRLEGRWKSSDHGGGVLEISGGKLHCRLLNIRLEGADEIVVLHQNDETDPDYFIIRNKEPSREHVGCFGPFTYHRGKLSAYLNVLDGDAMEFVFEKE